VGEQSSDRWDAHLYGGRHAFVWQYGAGVVELLDPRPGERVLDVGCGTGHLTKRIADAGAEVVGVDASVAMIEEARRNFPKLKFEIADATAMRFDQPFDAVFSNAALHWVKPPEAAVARMWEAIKPGGRLVIEMGGKGNVQRMLDAAAAAGREVRVSLEHVLHINYFPSVADYATLLEQQGFEVSLATLFDRPTPLQGDEGLRQWIRMFRGDAIQLMSAAQHEPFFAEMERIARPHLFLDNTWHADYRRLRVVARKRDRR
jgi:trans-aconitate methyltransferase